MSSLKPGFGRLATLGEVHDILDAHLPLLEPERVRLEDASLRVLADDVVAAIDVPHFVKAAMDGYAVVASDTFGASDSSPNELRIVDSLMPGQLATVAVEPGLCVEIGTGAPLPHGADAVVMVEFTEPAGSGSVSTESVSVQKAAVPRENLISVRKAAAPRENLIEVGSDVSKGSAILRRGTRLQPRHLGVLAAAGCFQVEVFRRPTVALFSTGPEIIEAGGDLQPGRIFDVNTHTLRAALVADGCAVLDLGIVPDDADLLEAALLKGLDEADVVLGSGGSSLGGADLVGDAFARVGELILHGVAVKPGKPVVLGTAKASGVDGEIEKMMIGLPGYPTSALSDYYIFVQPFLQRAMHTSVRASFVEAVLVRKHPSTVGRYEFLPVKLDGDSAIPLTKGSSAITPLAEADGFVEIDENIEVLEKGARVRVRLF